jgi:2-amino-4-hydroxy-6-hydroxymethyldihydropteridine diphosphokinase
MKTAYIGIGSNLGDAHDHCLQAIETIKQIPECHVKGVSPLYRTEPVGDKTQNWYVNGVVSVLTNLSAQILITHLLNIEANMGRVRKGKWESRIIDLDILLYGHDIIRDKNLVIPHMHMHTRRFVLAPMVDLAPDLVHPSFGKTMMELLQTIDVDDQVVQLVKDH